MPSIPASAPGLGAARVALVAIRAPFADHDLPSLHGPYVILADEAHLTADQAAIRLAVMPKPIWIAARPASDVITIETAPLSSNPKLESSHKWHQDIRDRAGPSLTFLNRRFTSPLDDLGVVCAAGHASVRVRVRDFHQFERDYQLAGYITRASHFADSAYPQTCGLTEEQVKGAAAFVCFMKSGQVLVL